MAALLPATLQPLAAVKDDVLVLSGLAHDKAKANGDGAGDPLFLQPSAASLRATLRLGAAPQAPSQTLLRSQTVELRNYR